MSATAYPQSALCAAIGDRFRLAGLADLTAVGAGFDRERFGALRTAASSVLPEFWETSRDDAIWSGERPTHRHPNRLYAPRAELTGHT